MLGEGIVTAVVGGNGHDGSRTVTSQHIFAHPNGNSLARKGIDGVRACEHARHLAVGDAVQLGALLHVGEILIDRRLLLGRGHLAYIFALGSQHHESNAKHGIGTGSEDSEANVTVLDTEFHLRSLGAAYPVALRFLQAVRPVYGIQSVEQALRVGRHTQAPLAHLFLHHGETSSYAHAVYYLVVGQHCAQSGAPVHHGLAQIGDTVIHQGLLLLLFAHALPFISREAQFFALRHVKSLSAFLLEVLYEFGNGLGFLAGIAIEAVKHLLESPLRPLIVDRVASAHFPFPVETETYLVQLLPVVVDVLGRGLLRMLPCLYGILLRGQSVSVITHGIEHVETLQSLVAGIDITGDITQWVSHMQSCPRGVRKHVEHVVFLFRLVLGHAIGFSFYPSALPFLFDFPEIVFHCRLVVVFFSIVVSPLPFWRKGTPIQLAKIAENGDMAKQNPINLPLSRGFCPG